LNLPAFLEEMRSCTAKGGSSSPPPAAYPAAFAKAGPAFVVTLSSKLSGSYNSAVMGKQFAEENGSADVHIFDSKSACAGELLLAIKISRLIKQKLSRQAIVESINHLIDGMKTYFVLERYDNQQKNVRLNKINGKIISILGMRLIMGADQEGHIALYQKARGESSMLEKMVALVEKSGKNTKGEEMVISHCNNPGLAQRLAAAVTQQFCFAHIHIVPTGGLSSLYTDNGGVVMAF
ncbi:MAG: DegV family protein, partial [Oscillospiraceae bacterium]